MPISARENVRIGDLVKYRGRLFVLRGVDPMSVTPQTAQVEDLETGELLVAPLSELERRREPAEPGE